MTTFVGTQTDFADALKALLELDYDAVEAYEVAINKLESTFYQKKLSEFKKDHEKHISQITSLLQQHKEEAPRGPDMKQWLAKGKVVLATLGNDNAILSAMLSNEEDTNSAYEKMKNHTGLWPDARTIIEAGYEDEVKHKAWIEETLQITSDQSV